MSEYKFVTKWDENTNIDWQRESRIELNNIIDFYNQWQICGFNQNKIESLLAKIEYGKQTIGNQDGGSAYLEELEEMEEFVKSKIV
jgi:hypothetical protein